MSQIVLLPLAAARHLTPWGGHVGQRDPERRYLAHVTLPPGWTTDWAHSRHGVPGALRDQHGRWRVVISWTARWDRRLGDYRDRPEVRFVEPDAYARAVAERGEPLVLDRWARPYLMIGTAAERVVTLRQLTETTPDQPAYESLLKTDCATRLASWKTLFTTLVQEIAEEGAEAIRYTADIVLATDDGHHVALIKRKHPPYEKHYALPGGHVDRGETSRQAAVRELAEEVGEEAGKHVGAQALRPIGVYDQVNRDPRGRYVSVAYLAQVPAGTRLVADDDATTAGWRAWDDLPADLAFDHAAILADARQLL